MHLRQRGDRRSESFGDMELGRRGVVFDNRIIFDVSATTFDNLTFGNQPQVKFTSVIEVFDFVYSFCLSLVYTLN